MQHIDNTDKALCLCLEELFRLRADRLKQGELANWITWLTGLTSAKQAVLKQAAASGYI